MKLWILGFLRGVVLRSVLVCFFGFIFLFFGLGFAVHADAALTINDGTGNVYVLDKFETFEIERDAVGRYSSFAPDGTWCNWDPSSPVTSSAYYESTVQPTPACDQGEGTYHFMWVTTVTGDCGGGGASYSACLGSSDYLGTDISVIVTPEPPPPPPFNTTTLALADSDSFRVGALGISFLVFIGFFIFGYYSIYES